MICDSDSVRPSHCPPLPDTHYSHNAHHLLDSHHSLSLQTANTDSIHGDDAAVDLEHKVHAHVRTVPDHLSSISPVRPSLFDDTCERTRVVTPDLPALPDLKKQTPLLLSWHPPPLPIPLNPLATASHAPPVFQKPSTSVDGEINGQAVVILGDTVSVITIISLDTYASLEDQGFLSSPDNFSPLARPTVNILGYTLLPPSPFVLGTRSFPSRLI